MSDPKRLFIIKRVITRRLPVLCCLMLLAFSGADLVGTAAPEWTNQRWINSSPLTLSQLRGKVVLIRFFMDSSCPLCRGSAPYLNEIFETYKNQGLIVIGMYTPKPEPRPTDTNVVHQYVTSYGFTFPIAIDDDWATLKKYWLDRVPAADYTSVSFLIDKKGVTRFIHPGGLYSKKDVAVMKKNIEKLIHD